MDGKDLKCSNCETHITPLWRKRGDGTYLCNACGLYKKIHGIDRPKIMKTDVVRHRKRTQKNKLCDILDDEDEDRFKDEDAFLLPIMDLNSSDKKENTISSDNNNKQNKNHDHKKQKKIAKKYIETNYIKNSTFDDDHTEKSYDDEFDYGIIDSLRNHHIGKKNQRRYYGNKEVEDKYIMELFTNYSESERLAVEGLLKLSRS